MVTRENETLNAIYCFIFAMLVVSENRGGISIEEFLFRQKLCIKVYFCRDKAKSTEQQYAMGAVVDNSSYRYNAKPEIKTIQKSCVLLFCMILRVISHDALATLENGCMFCWRCNMTSCNTKHKRKHKSVVKKGNRNEKEKA